MRNLRSRLWLVAVFLIGTAPLLRAQDCEKSLQALYDEAYAAALGARTDVQTESETQLDEIEEVVEAQPSAPAAPQGFASRVNDSLADFLPLFQFAVNSVSTADDEESVTVKFNPLRVGRHGTVSFTATATEPRPFESLIETIPESSRAEQEDLIGEALGDFDDVTWSATYGFQRSDNALRDASGRVSWSEPARLWGRNPLLYSDLFHVLMIGVWQKAIEDNDRDLDLDTRIGDIQEQIACGINPDCEINLREVTACDVLALDDGEDLLARYEELAAEEAEVEVEVSQALSDAKLFELVALIDNQPQATAKIFYRDADERVGQETVGVELAVEIGRRNLNTLLRRYREGKQQDDSETPLTAWERFRTDKSIQNKNRFTFSAAYLKRSNYSFTYQFETSEVLQDDGTTVVTLENVPLMLEEAEEVSGSFLYSRSMGWPAVRVGENLVTPRLDLSAEFVDVDDDPMRQDRLVARLGYILPLGSGMSLPFTLTWANHTEFLGEQDHELSAHFGLSRSW